MARSFVRIAGKALESDEDRGHRQHLLQSGIIGGQMNPSEKPKSKWTALLTVCEECHKKIHSRKEQVGQAT